MNTNFVLIWLILKSTAALIAYDCAHERINITTISLLSVGPCDLNNEQVIKNEEDIQLLQMTEVASLHIYQCKINIIQSVYKCGMFSHLSVVPGGLSTFIEEISHEDCMKIHQHHSYRLPNGRIIDNLRGNSSITHTEVIAGSLDIEGNCQGVPFTSGSFSWNSVIVMRAMEFTISDYPSSVHLQSNMVTLKNNVLCPYLNGKCIDPEHGMSFWNLIPDQSCEELQYDVLWQGKAIKLSKQITNDDMNLTHHIYTVATEETIFALEIKKPISVCRFPGFQTEHPRLVIVPRTTTEYWFKRRTISSQNLDLFTYINSKFVYTERHIRSQVEQLYANLLQKKCELERETLQTRLLIAPHYPAEFALWFTKEQGYMVVPRGELIYLIKCQPVEVLIRKTERCYIELPVNYTNRNYFMAPVTHLLQERGSEIPCSDLLNPGYQINGDWYGLNPTIHRMKNPRELSPSTAADWQYEDSSNFMQAGIYTPTSLDKLRHQIMYPSERRAINNILTHSVIGSDIEHQNIQAINLFSSHSLEQLFKTKAWSFITGFGNVYATLLAFYAAIKIIKFAIDVIINAKTLKAIFGWSWKLLAAVWNSLTNNLIHQHNNHNTKETIILDSVATLADRIQNEIPNASTSQAIPIDSLNEIDTLKQKMACIYPSSKRK